MFPDTIDSSLLTKEHTIQPSLTYRIDFTNKRILGKIDEREAILQAVRKIFATERYAYEIYDWRYGHEIHKLAGQSFAYVQAEMPRLVKEALLQDDRIKGVKDFVFEKTSIDTMQISCTVLTIYGELDYREEIRL